MSDTSKNGIELVETRSIQALQARIPSDNTKKEATGAPGNYIKDLRLHLITAAYEILVDYATPSLIRIFRLSNCLFLTSLEIPIVITALIRITNDLGGFQLSSWIVADTCWATLVRIIPHIATQLPAHG